MTRPVVLWTQANRALVIFSLVIPAQRINPALRCVLIEPARGEVAASSFDTLFRCALALIRHDHHFVLCSPQSRGVRDIVHLVIRVAIMWQPDLCFLRHVAALAHPFQMRGQRLSYGLVVVKDSYFLADELRDPDRNGIRFRAGAADVKEQSMRHERISSDPADALLEPRLV